MKMKRSIVLVGFLVFGLVAALAPPWRAIEAQANCFPETGFCITTSAFADYFNMRGGAKTLGYPISRTFTLEGFEVQFFQRVVLQLQGGTVNRLNLLDDNVMPMTRVNQSQFPSNDSSIASQAPSPSSPTYATDVVQFIQQVSPNTFEGQPVNFFNTFNSSVPAEAAGGNQNLLTLLNLEIWGLPTSNPQPDPGNGGFIYQRYQRGIMHFDAACGCTQGILVGEYFKAVITGQNLPPDLAADMQGSRYLGQYNPSVAGAVNRPGELQNTNLTGAFEPGTGAVTPGTGQPSASTPAPTAAAGATATPTAAAAVGPTVTIQVDDDLIDPGQSISITVIGRYPTAIKWIEWEGIDDKTGDNDNSDNGNGNANGNDNEGTTISEPEFQRKRFNCDDRLECANVWTVKPNVSGRYFLRARSEGKDDVRSEWVVTSLRIRAGSATATPTATAAVEVVTATATATSAAATATPTTAAATATVTPTP